MSLGSFEEYFKRQIELWGRETQETLLQKRILIVGSGGLGSSLGLALGGSGVGFIDLVDFDSVALHNIHRQIAFVLDDREKNKAKTLAKTIKSRNRVVEVNYFESSFEEFIVTQSRDYDLILDATDNLQTRAKIDTFAKDVKTPWIYGSVEEWNAQVCFFEKTSFSVFASKEHTPKGITAPMVMQTASFQATLALRYLANLPIKKDTLHYLYYNEEGDFTIQKFKMPI